MSMAKEKPLFDKDMPCPHCSKGIHIRVRREVITKAIPGETKIVAFVEKGSQTTLTRK